VEPQAKYELLLERLAEHRSMLVAYSGGIDSTLLTFAAHAVLGSRCSAVLATSDTYPQSEVTHARELAATLGFSLLEVETYELADPRFAENTPDRCYYCKSELFSLLARVADVNGFSVMADGSNIDDLADFRPGSKAKAECGVLSPLQEAGMTKADIRAIARDLGLPNWNKPSMACLASRFPYGEAISEHGLARVALAESALSSMGFSQYRVRAHGDVARLEISDDEMQRAWIMREQVAKAVRNAGFTWVAQDLDGYRSGSLNEVLSNTEIEQSIGEATS